MKNNIENENIIFLEKAKNGDVDAFEKLIASHQEKIYNFAYQLTGNEPDARDISQETIIKVYNSLKNFRKDSSFSTWLWRIVYNTFLNECKSSYRKKSLLTVSVESLFNLRDNNPEPDKEIENLDFQKQVEQTLLKLPVKYRMTIAMHDMQGIPYEEIARICKISMGTVKSRLNRGRKMLKRIILKSGTFF